MFKTKILEWPRGINKKIPPEEKILVGGDLNGHVGRITEDFRSIHRDYGLGVINEEGGTILDFTLAYDFIIANTLFKKDISILSTIRMGPIK